MNAAFLSYLAAMSHLAPSSLDCHRNWLTQLEAHCQKHGLGWESCREQDLDRFRTALLWRPHTLGKLYSSNSVHQGLRVLRHFYRWARREQLIRTDPTQGWFLPRPLQSEQPVLEREQLSALLNLADLIQPEGTRDQLVLELVFSLFLFIPQCRALQLDQVGSEYLELGERRLELEPIKPALERYLTSGRPNLVKGSSPFLLLTSRGQPYLTNRCLAIALRDFGQRLGLAHNLTARTLHRSHRAQLEQLARRHSRV